MKRLNKLFVLISHLAAPLALTLAILTANSTCFYLSHQPDEPDGLKSAKLRDFQNQK